MPEGWDGVPHRTARYSLAKRRSRICWDSRAAAIRLRAKTMTPDTWASSRWTVRMQSVCSWARSSSGIPPGSSVDSTPTGFTATTMRSS